jgi:hypothetical protein
MVHPEEGGRSPGEKPIDFAALNPGHVSLFVTAGLDPAIHLSGMEVLSKDGYAGQARACTETDNPGKSVLAQAFASLLIGLVRATHSMMVPSSTWSVA